MYFVAPAERFSQHNLILISGKIMICRFKKNVD